MSGDYMVDGLLHCWKCGTPKQVRLNFRGIERLTSCLCKCESEALERSEIERKAAEAKSKAVRFARGKVDFAQTFDADDGKCERGSKIARSYARNFASVRFLNVNGLVFYGRPDQGKTFFCNCIANELVARGETVQVCSCPEIVAAAQKSSKDPLTELRGVDLLIVDDFGSERQTSFAYEVLYRLIDGRYSKHLPTIVSTNYTAQDLAKPDTLAKQRLFNRILGICLPVEVEAGRSRFSGSGFEKAETEVMRSEPA